MRGLAIAAIALCAMPASSDPVVLSQQVVAALTLVDSMPTSAAISAAFASPQSALQSLQTIALDHDADLGIQLRAIRSLPGYCPPAPASCGTGTAAHDTLLQLVQAYSGSPRSPQDLLRLRTAVEALGAARAGGDDDVAALVALLDDPSRDLRATVVGALRAACNPLAITPLQTLKTSEPSSQVLLAIYTALQVLEQCAN